MKKLFLIFLFALVGCAKKNTPQPDYATPFLGTWVEVLNRATLSNGTIVDHPYTAGFVQTIKFYTTSTIVNQGGYITKTETYNDGSSHLEYNGSFTVDASNNLAIAKTQNNGLWLYNNGTFTANLNLTPANETWTVVVITASEMLLERVGTYVSDTGSFNATFIEQYRLQ